MAEPGARGGVRRIVTAIPASTEIAPLLRLAARMAGHCDAQVTAVLVHNEALLRLASLPVTRHLLAATGAAEPLTTQSLRLAMAASGQHLRESMDAILGAARISWTLHTLADENDAALPVELQSEDLLLISAEARIVDAWFGADLAVEPAVAAFTIRSDGEVARDVVAVHDGTDAGRRALTTAIMLARAQNGCCHVVMPEALSPEIRQQIDVQLAAANQPCGAIVVSAADLSSLVPVMRDIAAGIVVLPADILRQPGLAQTLRQLVAETRGKL